MLLRLIKRYLSPYKSWLAIVIGLQFVSTMASLYLPSLNADIIDNGVTRGDTDYILRIGGVMLVVSLVHIACTVVAVYYASKSSMAFGRDMRAGLFHHIESFSGREVSHFGAPSLITRTTNDIQQVQTLVMMSATMMVMAPIMMIGGILMALREDVGLSWLVAVSVPVLAIAIALIIRKTLPGFRAMQQRIDNVNRVLREQITGVRVVRAFVREPYETERFANANDDLTEVARLTGRWMAATFPIVLFVFNVSVIGVLWFGALRVDAGVMQVGALTAFMTYLMQILMSVMMATFMLMMIPRASVSAKRIVEVLDTSSSVAPSLTPVSLPEARGELVLDRVEFSYPGAEEPVLRDISFTASPGQFTAIIGSTGSGKSTLVDLIPRLYDVTGGSVHLDGVDVRDLDPDALWRNVGLIPQRAYLFSGTVASNLRFGKPDATEEEMWEALDVAQASDFVAAMPEGLDSPIAQGGTNVSGGQRQRLAIARAVIKRPRVYVFDDAFSALDLATDARLRRELRAVVSEATLLVVAQRVSTIVDADQILVIEDGEIVSRGTHHELLASSPTYREIVFSQITEEEVA
jgi:ATP-binding cassette, subfamily B, multidrug efflux pump